ncbi:VWA domain-containing protein [Candidatus Sumerlaeota bacterium]|nr:VWA domain-containing protein [Candidatus Sumerlaeota bacterium]
MSFLNPENWILWIREFRFASPQYLLLLLFIPLLAVAAFRRRKMKSASFRFSDIKHLKTVSPTLRIRLRNIIPLLRLAALCLLIVAMARPQSGWTERNVKTEGIDILLALDVSYSMKAMDFDPNRLEAAKKVISEFVSGREADRIGCVLFASTSFTLCPLTLDYGVIKGFLDNVEFGVIDGNSTAIGLGLANCVNKMKDSHAKSKVVILLTDGENNVWDIAPLTAAEAAKALGIRVYTIGVGTLGRAFMPVDRGVLGIVKVPVDVRIDEKTLTEIANMTGGKYYRATDNEKLKEIYEEIDQLEKTKIEFMEHQYFDELMSLAALPALVLLLLEILLAGTYFLKLP